jgi:hypothetical protein
VLLTTYRLNRFYRFLCLAPDDFADIPFPSEVGLTN